MAAEDAFLADIARIAARTVPPERESLDEALAAALTVLESVPSTLRPADSEGLPGGLVRLPLLPTAILPDIHARPDFLEAAFNWTPPGAAACLACLLAEGRANMVVLGDLFHSEAEGAAQVWRMASMEYAGHWAERSVMDGEMSKALAGALIVLRATAAFPGSFFCLKGNHDNIANEEGRGDHPFYKYAREGAMASSWFLLTYGPETLAEYHRFELDLPLAVCGDRFVASHGEPAFALRPKDIIEYRRRPEVVEALIWTPNDGAARGSVEDGLAAFFADREPGTLWFGGHRPIEPGRRYMLRANGRYVQFHAPGHRRLVWLEPGRDPDPERDIVGIGGD